MRQYFKRLPGLRHQLSAKVHRMGVERELALNSFGPCVRMLLADPSDWLTPPILS